MRRFVLFLFLTLAARAADKPNILWITCEDSSPHLGCYDDPNANTPNIDTLAKRGLLFRHAWSNAPVCAPARTCIISGRWAPSDGAEHMRSEVPMPGGHKMFPQLLREAGYYCTNNSKEDYNLIKSEGVWDESSKKAHWRNRKPGQPFFAVFNLLITHESQIRARPHTLVHDPAKVVVPPYMPDTPEVRHDWAQHFDNLTTMDGQAAEILKALEDDGLAQDTIVFFYADHGTGMPRSKRWPMNSGLQVPFITYFPEKYQAVAPFGYRAGAHTDQMIGFIDLAPTVLRLASMTPPAYMQGSAFAGEGKPAPRQFNFGFRGRMDERIDLTRSITDGRYVYIRQFMPHLPYGQHIGYMFEMPTTRVWNDLFEQGKLTPQQSVFWKPKPHEELYDLQADPWEIRNLAQDPEMVVTRTFLRQTLATLLERTRDLGFIPEAQRLADSAGQSPKDAFADNKAYPVKEVVSAALLASDLTKTLADPLLPLLAHENAVVRYWGVMGLVMRGADTVKTAHDAVLPLLDDKSSSVRVAAAEALMAGGTDADQEKAWTVLLAAADPKNGAAMASVEALNV
ncbi:MAG: Choline-sulfatase, partial [Verrucomicrobiaceae bacterium]|nr:Choline-sulfatase [Verrucomicrobiaceae bacterium]